MVYSNPNILPCRALHTCKLKILSKHEASILSYKKQLSFLPSMSRCIVEMTLINIIMSRFLLKLDIRAKNGIGSLKNDEFDNVSNVIPSSKLCI
jgi:hypothetical protein